MSLAPYLGGCWGARRLRRREHHWFIVMQSSGHLKFTPAGLIWRRKQGSKVVEVKKDGKSAQTVPALSHWAEGCEGTVGGRGVTSYPCLGAEIDFITWSKVPRGCQLSVRRKGGTTINFLGFRDKVRSTAVSQRAVPHHLLLEVPMPTVARLLTAPPGPCPALHSLYPCTPAPHPTPCVPSS